MRYHPHTDGDEHAMLETIGVKKIGDLFRSIPEKLRLMGPLDLPPALDEIALVEEFQRMAAMNDIRHPPFIGAGYYPHHVPAVVDQLTLRGEFFTAYTPYQPEISQGTLQALFEWQTFVTLLTGLEVANASMYDGASAAAEAVLMAARVTKRKKVVLSAGVHPEYRRVIVTYLRSTHDEIVTVPYTDREGTTDLGALEKAIDDSTAAVVVGYPNFFGVIEPLGEVSRIARAKGAMVVSTTAEAVSLGLLKGPGELGADIAVGTFQSFGNPLIFGGPGPGFFATREKLVRQMPGRLAGATVNRLGRPAFVLTLSTREQHIRREDATSNICTNSGLTALAATMHLALLGRTGLAQLARLNRARGTMLREALGQVGIEPRFTGPTFNEVAFRVKDVEGALQRATAEGIAAGVPLERWYPELGGSLLSAATEVHSPELIARMAAAVSGRPTARTRDSGRGGAVSASGATGGTSVSRQSATSPGGA